MFALEARMPSIAAELQRDYQFLTGSAATLESLGIGSQMLRFTKFPSASAVQAVLTKIERFKIPPLHALSINILKLRCVLCKMLKMSAMIPARLAPLSSSAMPWPVQLQRALQDYMHAIENIACFPSADTVHLFFGVAFDCKIAKYAPFLPFALQYCRKAVRMHLLLQGTAGSNTQRKEDYDKLLTTLLTAMSVLSVRSLRCALQ